MLLVLGISTTHSKEYIEGKGGSHDFVNPLNAELNPIC